MSIRSDYPMYFDTTQIPFPNTCTENSQVVESVKTTEAGTDIINVARYNKLHATLSFTCLQDTLQTLAGFSEVDSFVFKRYNPKIGIYDEKTVRMRNFNHSMRKGSEDLTVNGVWDVSFDLEEF